MATATFTPDNPMQVTLRPRVFKVDLGQRGLQGPPGIPGTAAATASTFAGLGTPTAGEIRRVTDERRGLYYATGTEWVRLGDTVDVILFGATLDGTTDDLAAIQALSDALESLGGGIIFVPNGSLGLSDTFEQAPNVTVQGESFNGAEIKALAGFTATNPLIRQGVTSPTTADLAFGCRLENIKVNCNDIVNVGVYSQTVNEHSGVVGAQVVNYLTRGIHYQGGGLTVGTGLADNYALRSLHIYCSATAVGSVGIEVENGLSKSIIDDVTINVSGAGVEQADAILFRNVGGLLDELGRGAVTNLHVEKHANAVRCGTWAKVAGFNIEARNCTRTIQIDSDAGLCDFTAVAATGTTPTFVRDQQLTVTVAPSNPAKKLLSHYSNRQQDSTRLGFYLGEDLKFHSAALLDWNGDTSMFRAAAGIIRSTNSSFSVQAASSGNPVITGFLSGDTTSRVSLQPNGLSLGPGNAALDTRVFRSFATGAPLATDKDFAIETVGRGLRVKEGSNAKMGVATLVAGSVVVATTAVAATSRIMLTAQADGGTPGFQRVSTRTAGTSFTITSSSGSDTSTVAWIILDPA